MVIVYGWKTDIKIDKDLGSSECENCKHNENRFLAREIFKINIFGIPIFKKTVRRMVMCNNCGIIEQLNRSEYNKRLKEI